MKTIAVPTGHIIIDNYLATNGNYVPLETLSIADHGKHNNVKADFLGFYNEISSVPSETMSYSEKWVMTLSTQSGCPMKCTFCDAKNVPFTGNASVSAFTGQVMAARNLHPDVFYTDRLNVHFARMGEPAFNYYPITRFTETILGNKRVFQDLYKLRVETIHPVLTTMIPITSKDNILDMMDEWIRIKNTVFNGQAGLQLSINSTSDSQRDKMFGGKSWNLEAISDMMKRVTDGITILGRKLCLNFALADGYEIDGQKLAKLFNPEHFMCKITPIHNSEAAVNNGIKTTSGYESYTPYKAAEQSLKDAGFDVLVFIPSIMEETGCITCGNAILGGSIVKTATINTMATSKINS